jgi:hypothetical protein
VAATGRRWTQISRDRFRILLPLITYNASIAVNTAGFKKRSLIAVGDRKFLQPPLSEQLSGLAE